MTEKRAALIIATNEYDDAGLRQLIAPAQDAEALARVLSDSTICEFDVELLLNVPSHKVGQAVEAFFGNCRREDLLLLYFSCHGIKDQKGRLYFATKDTARELLRTTAVPAAFVNEVMHDSRSRRQILLLDTCYSGAFARGMVAKADRTIGTRERFEGYGRVVLTASDAMQYVYEGDSLTTFSEAGVRSVFTNALVHGLETGQADVNQDGYVSLDELYRYIYDRVTSETPHQEPRKWELEVQGEIVIARNVGLISPEMILIPAGEFPMGSDPRTDKDVFDNELPQHSLYLPDFCISRTPVTNAQYAAFVWASGHRRPRRWMGDRPLKGRESHPVVTVSWHDAVAYCRWLSKVTGRLYRLPSEAEWEKAARGTDGRIYPWGNHWDAEMCNTYEGGMMDTVPVGSYPRGASPYGVLDMAGNLWEWTRSVYRSYPYDPNDGREDPITQGAQMMRGCPYGLTQNYARCACRGWFDPVGQPVSRDLLAWDLGFRLVAESMHQFTSDSRPDLWPL